jgi:hypothetical protein
MTFTRTIRCLYAALTIFQCILLLASLERPAYGYVDPGSGVLLVQVLSSALGGIVFFLRKRLRRYLQLTRKVLTFHPSGRPDELQP